tara:strand:+ start:703 stop:1158 length:456 start_codon:yes stop_codon:yes gene_type:complete
MTTRSHQSYQIFEQPETRRVTRSRKNIRENEEKTKRRQSRNFGIDAYNEWRDYINNIINNYGIDETYSDIEFIKNWLIENNYVDNDRNIMFCTTVAQDDFITFEKIEKLVEERDIEIIKRTDAEFKCKQIKKSLDNLREEYNQLKTNKRKK